VRVDRFVLESAVLRGNPLGDPAGREVIALLPPGYDAGDRRYPVLHVLPAFTSFGASLLQRACWEEALDQRLARLFAQGCPPAIVVLVDGCTKLGGSQYVNSSATGRYADHLLDEIVPAIDARYRTLARRESRAILGKSSGGFGSLHLTMSRPGLFGAVACHSGDLAFDLCYPPAFPGAADALGRAGGVKPFLAGFFSKVKRTPADVSTIEMIAMSAAYSPNPRSPDGFDLPFELAACDARPEVFARWLELDPVRRVERSAAALRDLKLLFVDCGARDEYHLHFGARRLARECRARGIAVEHEEFDDGHRSTAYRYDVSIPKLVRALS
jgi:enterochelin esterase family protein